jgi:hypothetical protein
MGVTVRRRAGFYKMTRKVAGFGRSTVLVYALVSSQARDAVELYVRREDAQAALLDALEDVPEWQDVLRVEAVVLESG